MLRNLLLYSTVCSLFVLGYFLPRWSGPKNCINSSLVEEITVEKVERPILKCNLKNRSLTEAPPEWVRDIRALERVEDIEFMAYFWAEPDTKLRLHLDDSLDSYVSFRDGVLQVSPAALSEPGVFEKALMTYWLGINDPVTAQSAVDFLWKTRQYEEMEQDNSFWLKHLVSLRSYCGLKLNTLHHEDFCSIQRELGDGLVVTESDGGSVHWSMHNVFSQIMSKVFKMLPLKDKQKFVHRLIFLNKIEEPYPWAHVSYMESLGELDLTFWNQVLHIFSSLDIDYNLLWAAAWEHLPSRSNQEFHYTVVDRDISWNLPVGMNPRNSFVEHSSSKFLFPSDIPLRFSRNEIMSSMKVDGVSIVACETPTPKRLLEFQPYTNKVLFVRVCDDKPQQVAEILSMTPPKFIASNSEVEFIEFNLSALKLASDNKGSLQSHNEIQSWSKWLEWQDFVYDKERSAYRPRAVYDGIGWFRSAN